MVTNRPLAFLHPLVLSSSSFSPFQIHMSRWTCTMEKSVCAKRRPTWRSAPLTQSSTSFLCLICPLKKAWGTLAWSCCWWTLIQALLAPPTLSSAVWCWEHWRQAPLASTGGRSVTTRVARSPNGTACPRIRRSTLLTVSDVVQERRATKRWVRWMSRWPLPIGLSVRGVWDTGDGTVCWRGGHLNSKRCHYSINHSTT